MEESFMFGAMHLDLLEQTKSHLESHGHTCRVEESQVHTTKLYTLVSTPPERPTRKERGCGFLDKLGVCYL